jgi:hypothetical protein
VDKYRKRLERLAYSTDPTDIIERKKLTAEMEELLLKEEVLWRQ